MAMDKEDWRDIQRDVNRDARRDVQSEEETDQFVMFWIVLILIMALLVAAAKWGFPYLDQWFGWDLTGWINGLFKG